MHFGGTQTFQPIADSTASPFQFLFPKVPLGHQDVVTCPCLVPPRIPFLPHLGPVFSEFGVIGVMQVTWRLFNLEGGISHKGDGEREKAEMGQRGNLVELLESYSMKIHPCS